VKNAGPKSRLARAVRFFIRAQMFWQRLKQFGIIFGAWTTLALFAGSQWYLATRHSDQPVGLRFALLTNLVEHWTYAVLTPLALWVSARFPFVRRHWLRASAAHLLGLGAFLMMFVSIRVVLNPIIYATKPTSSLWVVFQGLILTYDYTVVWMYGGIVAASQIWNYYRKYRDRELRASRLEAQLAQAQLKILKMQLDPHFLFNTLHSISSLMHDDVETADSMLTRLGDLLRMSLENVNQPEVTLKREMEFLEGYIEIQQQRFRDRLRVSISIDPRSLDALVPNMILQPLVENAFKHGIAAHTSSGRVEIRSEVRNGTLRLEVRDDGPGTSSRTTDFPAAGVGFENTRARLRQLYGDSHSFRFQRIPDGGAMVTLEIPFRLIGDESFEEVGNAPSGHHRG